MLRSRFTPEPTLSRPRFDLQQGFLYGGHRVGIVRFFHHGKAYAVMRHALVDLQLLHKRTGQGNVQVFLLLFQSHHSGCFFYNSGKHKENYEL